MPALKRTKTRASSRTVTPAEALITPAIYLRVSTEEQKSGQGLDVQLRRCLAQALVKDWAVDEERHIFRDEGISGTKDATQREGLAALLAAVEAGQVNAVIVLALDRLGRKTKIVLDVVERITEAGAELVSCKESLDTTTPAGRFVLTVFAALAQLERDNIVQRTSDGREERGSKDGEMGGRLPYGYRRVRDAKTGETIGVEVDRELALIVKRIDRAERVYGRSQRRIAAELNAAGLPGPRGGKWHASSIGEILKNRPAYKGGRRGDSEMCWPTIL